MATLHFGSLEVKEVTHIEVLGGGVTVYPNRVIKYTTRGGKTSTITVKEKAPLLITAQGDVHSLIVTNCAAIEGCVSETRVGNVIEVSDRIHNMLSGRLEPLDSMEFSMPEHYIYSLAYYGNMSHLPELPTLTLQLRGNLKELKVMASGVNVVGVKGNVQYTEVGNCLAVKGSVGQVTASNRARAGQGQDVCISTAKELWEKRMKKSEEVMKTLSRFFNSFGFDRERNHR